MWFSVVYALIDNDTLITVVKILWTHEAQPSEPTTNFEWNVLNETQPLFFHSRRRLLTFFHFLKRYLLSFIWFFYNVYRQENKVLCSIPVRGKTKVSSYRCFERKVKLTRLLRRRIIEFEMNENQCKTSEQSLKAVMFNSNCWSWNENTDIKHTHC